MTTTGPGYRLAHITCRHCGRTAKLPAEKLPPKANGRLRCRTCGHRGADYVLAWHIGGGTANVVPLRTKPQ